MPQSSRTRAAIRTAVGKMSGAIVYSRTATAGANGSLTDSNVNAGGTTLHKGKVIILRPGTSTEERREITAYTSPGVFTVLPVWSANPANGDAFEIYDPAVALPEQIDEFINQALVRVFDLCGQPFYSDELTVGDVLFGDGQFEVAFATDATYTNMARNAAGSGAGTVSRQTGAGTYTRGSAGMRFVNTASNALAVDWTIGRFRDYASAKFTLKTKVRITSSVTDRARMRANDGITTTNSNYYSDGVASTANQWLEISKDVTIAANPSTLVFSLRTETGTAITVEWDDFRVLRTDTPLLTYPLRTAADRLHAVWIGDGNDRFTEDGILIPGEDWWIERGATPQLRLRHVPGLVVGRRMLLMGQEIPALYSDSTTGTQLTDEQYQAVITNAVWLTLLHAAHAETVQNDARLVYWQDKAGQDMGRCANIPASSFRLR